MSELHTLPHALPTEMGVDPRGLLRLLDAVEEKKIGLQGLVVVRHGCTVAQGWWDPYSPALPHELFSLSKSFTSMAVGFCIQEGLLSMEDKAVDFFPEKLPTPPCANMEKVTVRHLLTMCTGHDVEPSCQGDDWAKEFLTSYLPLEPGTRSRYNTPAVYMLSAIVQRVSGLPTGEYLQPRLFEPLGIEGWSWQSCPMGVHAGGTGLRIRTGDIARFGQFLLQKGMWNGKQLLDAQWLGEATSYQVKSYGEKDWGAGYGYLFWQCVLGQGTFRADGAFGQFCIVLPALDMVIAANAGQSDMQGEMDVFWEYLLPCAADDALPVDPEAQAELERRLAALRIEPPAGMPGCETARLVSGAVYELSDNPFGITAVSLSFGETSGVTFWLGERKLSFGIGYNEWISTETGLSQQEIESCLGIFFDRTACAGAWEAGEYLLKNVHSTTPNIDLLRFTFDENALVLHIRRNVAPEGSNSQRLIGRRISAV